MRARHSRRNIKFTPSQTNISRARYTHKKFKVFYVHLDYQRNLKTVYLYTLIIIFSSSVYDQYRTHTTGFKEA